MIRPFHAWFTQLVSLRKKTKRATAAVSSSESTIAPASRSSANPAGPQVMWMWVSLTLAVVTAFGFGMSSLHQDGNWMTAIIRSSTAFGVVNAVMLAVRGWLF